MLQQKLNDDDIAVLEIFSDPVWCGEFLRSTADGEIDTALHPPSTWSYRDYQRQFLSDTSEFILYTGGRAIGKCQPVTARILTPDGYRTIGELTRERAIIVYSLTQDMQLEQRRAVISFDKFSRIYTVKTETGYIVDGTENHPVLTPDGYKLIRDLTPQDYIGVATYLPYTSGKQGLQWHELRMLGYCLLAHRFYPSSKILPRFKRIGAELEEIADRFIAKWHKDPHTGEYSIHGRQGPFKHPIRLLAQELGIDQALSYAKVKRIPRMLMNECLEHIRLFIEALFAQYATLSAQKITIQLNHQIMCRDIQELLLRFGIETIYSDTFLLETLDERAAYRFWKTFNLPGVAIDNLKLPAATNDATEFMRWDRVVSIRQTRKNASTYAIYVYGTNNYISDNVFVHNTVVLEDKFVYDVINQDQQFKVTKEAVLTTPNQAQMTPLLNKLILRFTSGKLLKEFLRNQINRSQGTMQFTLQGKPLIYNFRIAGSRGENNLVGLHVPRITGDEMQLFPQGAFTQMGPIYNSLN